MDVFNALAPVFFIVILGVFLRRSGFMPAAMVSLVNKLTFWVALPALLFLETAETHLDFLRRTDLFFALIGGTVAGMAAGYIASLVMRLPPEKTGALVQASFRGNIAYIGIPVIAYTIGEENRSILSLSVLMVAVLLTFNNMAAVLVLLDGQPRFHLRALKMIATWLVANPLIIACAAGLFVAWLGLELPLAVSRTLTPLGNMALPLALLGIGSNLDLSEIRGLKGPILTASMIKVFLTPLAGFALARMVGLSIEEERAVLVMLACPTASASFIMAGQMGGDTQITAGAIVGSTVLSFISLFIIIWL